MTSANDSAPGHGIRQRMARTAEAAGQLDRQARAALRKPAAAPRTLFAPPPEDAADTHPEAPRPLPRPLHCEWSWRPEPWQHRLDPACREEVTPGTALAPGIALHHDGAGGHVAFAQKARPQGPAPFALDLVVAAFDGEFVSLAIDLPEAGRRNLHQRHLVGLWLAVSAPAPLALHARLNIRHGPNTAQSLREVAPDMQQPGGRLIEFDLAYCPFMERQVSHVWCDVIFGGGELSRVSLRDLGFTRRPRAEI